MPTMIQPHQHDSKLIWDLAENEDNRNRARVFERDWHESYRLAGYRPAIDDYLPAESVARQAALLALARVDMACRFDTEDTPRVEEYLHLLDVEEVTPEFVAGLAFEEYMLRLENDEKPNLREYRKRFPGAVRLIQELFMIQEAVAGESLEDEGCSSHQIHDGFPRIGETIECFELIDELGCGCFAKVYLARDSTLAGREIALKATRGNHREWLTLAKLQHTHIVPIYSYTRTVYEDSEFDLVCMPYFGKVTFNILIDHEKWGQCIDGRDIQDLVDSLQPESMLDETRDSSSRSRLAEMSFAQAVAWWGACLADAMRHAHERRILHRDIKPTNILITPDCEPMLLDFNLAYASPSNMLADVTEESMGSTENSIGGTLAYMAPEHLEAMISGQSRLVDQRADIYALGAVLYEALTRSDVMKKSHAPAENRIEMLRQTLELRKLPPMAVRDIAPDVPLVLERVIRKCLEPDPARRYANASQLSEDLRAIALDQPVRHAQEPITNRIRRSFKRNRRVLVALTIMIVFMFLGPGLSIYRRMELQKIKVLSKKANEDLESARSARIVGDFRSARALQLRVEDAIREEPALADLYNQARQEAALTDVMDSAKSQSSQFFNKTGWLRYKFAHSTRLGGELDPEALDIEIQQTVMPILQSLAKLDPKQKSILTEKDWLAYLPQNQIEEVRHWLEILLFEGICAQYQPNTDSSLRSGLKLSMAAATHLEPGLPWTILNERLSAALERRPVNPINWPEPNQESSAIACLEFAQLALIDGMSDRANHWLRRAIALRPADPWVHHELAMVLERRGENAAAIDRLEIATSLDPSGPWARLDHARLARIQGQFAQARDDIQSVQQIVSTLQNDKEIDTLLNLERGQIEFGLGDLKKAEETLSRLVYDKSTAKSLKLLAIQSLSEILLIKGGWDELQYLLDQFDPEHDPHSTWALIRARLLLGQNRIAEAKQCLDTYLESNPKVIKAREMKALALLKLNQFQDALKESQEIVRQSDIPLHRRQMDRYRIAVLAELPVNDPDWFKSLVALRLEDPESVQLSPWMTRTAICQVIENFHAAEADGKIDHPLLRPLKSRFYLNLAILQSSIGNDAWRKSLEKSLSSEDSSISTIRSQVMVLIYHKKLEQATKLLDVGLGLSFEDPELIDLRAKISHEQGNYELALREYDEILKIKEIHSVRAWRAKTLVRLGRWNEALADLSNALSLDPFHPDWRVERALIWKRLGRADLAIADLYMASVESRENPLLGTRLAMAQAVVASNEPNESSDYMDVLKEMFRTSWPDVFNRAGLNDLELKSDTNVRQAEAVVTTQPKAGPRPNATKKKK